MVKQVKCDKCGRFYPSYEGFFEVHLRRGGGSMFQEFRPAGLSRHMLKTMPEAKLPALVVCPQCKREKFYVRGKVVLNG